MNIGVYDGQAVLTLLQSLSWVALVGGIIYILLRIKPIEAKTKRIILILFATWATTSVLVSITSLFQYYDNRDSLKEYISAQQEQEKFIQ